jgi:protein TonB
MVNISAMDTNKILSANILDLIFDDRNKEYGAYELRVTYPRRIKKALLITASVGVLIFGGAVLANSFQPKEKPKLDITEVIIQNLPDEPEPLPEPEKKIDPPQTRTDIFTPPAIVEDDKVEEPPPTQDDYKDAKIDVVKTDGVADEGLANVQEEVGQGKGIIEENKASQELWVGPVEVEAKCACDWEKFLRKNLNGQVPADNGAPEGRYTVIIQFVVDVDGTVSDVKPLTSHGYGMEQEAVRVLRRAMKWEPAFQNKMHVKAYRKQPITFEVLE